MTDKTKSAALVIDTRRPRAQARFGAPQIAAEWIPDASQSSNTLWYNQAETPSTLATSQYASRSLTLQGKCGPESADSCGSEWLLGKINEFLAESPEAGETIGGPPLYDSQVSPLRMRMPRSPLRIEAGLTSALFYRGFSKSTGPLDAAPFPYSPTVEVATVATGVRVSMEYGSLRCISRDDMLGLRKEDADSRRYSRLSFGSICVDATEDGEDGEATPITIEETPPLQTSPASLSFTSLSSGDSSVSSNLTVESCRPSLSPTITITRDTTATLPNRACTADKPTLFPPAARGLSRSASVGFLSALGRARKVSLSSSSTRPKLVRVATTDTLRKPTDPDKRAEEMGQVNMQDSPTSTQIVAGRKMHKLKQLLGAEVEEALSPDAAYSIDKMKPLPNLPRTRLQRSGTTVTLPALHRDGSVRGWSKSRTCKATVTGRPSSARESRCTCPACKLGASPHAKMTTLIGYGSR